jgi:hypothetical protein
LFVSVRALQEAAVDAGSSEGPMLGAFMDVER